MPVIPTARLRLYYERGGTGPRLLYLPGSGTDLRYNRDQLEGPLPRSFDVVTYDHRGLGQSESPPQPWTMADFADDAAALLDAIGWPACSVFGLSFGGMVAQELALRHPGRVERLVLASTSSGGAGGSSYPLHELAALPAQERAATALRLVDTRGLTANPVAGPGQPPTEGQRGQLEARSRHDTWERLPSLRIPVLVCVGRYDGIAPPANAEALAGQIPGARLETFDGGHQFLQQDDRAYGVIVDWLTA